MFCTEGSVRWELASVCGVEATADARTHALCELAAGLRTETAHGWTRALTILPSMAARLTQASTSNWADVRFLRKCHGYYTNIDA